MKYFKSKTATNSSCTVDNHQSEATEADTTKFRTKKAQIIQIKK